VEISDNLPIIVGVAQKTWRDTDLGRTPVDALTEVSALALADMGPNDLAQAVDAVAMVRFIGDTDPGMAALFPRNPGRQIAERLGITKASFFQGVIGGNTPQYLVNHFARKLASGEHSAVMISGTELLATMISALRSGGDISTWCGKAEDEPTTIGQERDGLNDTEKLYGLYEPINTYPLFENSLRHHLGISSVDHQTNIANICSAMSEVAATNPHAWKPVALSEEQVRTVDKSNRYIGFPYTKAMNPVIAVDMAASVIMTTVGRARELGIDSSQWIYLRGGIDINDCWYVSERPSLHESPAIRLGWKTLSEATGINIDAVTDFDIYSCFPSAVQVTCNEIGLSPMDPRGVTVTGGLPYLGGPGNNYSLHGIAEMVSTLRRRGKGHGLVTANGLYLTKHSLGLYSTEPVEGAWQAVDDSALQQQIDELPTVSLAQKPAGPAIVETFTVRFDREGPKTGIVVARNAEGKRILAYTRDDTESLNQLLSMDPVGRSGQIVIENEVNIFEF
jgi:acetyl-CoA C-acetyltransferase